MTSTKRLGILVLASAAVGAAGAREASAACSDAPEVTVKIVDKTFPSGSRWFFSVIRRQCEGLAVGTAFYQPRGAADFIKVLDRGYISEIQVSYASGAPGSLEVTTTNEGLGDTNTAGNSFAVPLTTSECNHELLDGNRVCVDENAGEGYRWRHGDETPRMAHAVEVFMSSQVGKENYITKWEFHDDGTIEASLGITGTVPLIKTSSNSAYNNYGARLNASGTPTMAISHHHNVYWFLDFDIGGAGDDKVIQSVFKPDPPDDCAQPGVSPGTCGEMTFTHLNTEAARAWSSTEQTTWTIFDKVQTNFDTRNLAYEIAPHQSGIWRGMTSGSEPWSGSELWVTSYNGCERFAAKNVTPHLPAHCAGSRSHVQAMVDGQSVDGADVVVWYAQRMLHNHRDEDEANMPIQWMHFEIKPRNFFHKNPIEP